MNEDEISAIYVRLGNDFNTAAAAFTKEGIDMRFAHAPPPRRARTPKWRMADSSLSVAVNSWPSPRTCVSASR